jgi:hypothetical protein
MDATKFETFESPPETPGGGPPETPGGGPPETPGGGPPDDKGKPDKPPGKAVAARRRFLRRPGIRKTSEPIAHARGPSKRKRLIERRANKKAQLRYMQLYQRRI